MDRITAKTLDDLTARMNRDFWHYLKNDGDQFAIDKAYGGYRLVIRHADTSESDISDRGTAKETANFMRGMLEGLYLAANHYNR